MPNVIGHYYWHSNNGQAAPSYFKVDSEEAADAEVAELDVDPLETWVTYMAVHDDGTVRVFDYGMDEIGCNR